MPSYDQDEDTDPPPTAVAHLRESIGRANALLISTPEYNHSVPGYSRTRWTGRRVPTARVSSSTPAAVIGASVSQFGAQWAQEHLRRVLDACQSEVLDVELAVSEAADRIEAGELVDAEIREELRMIVRQVVGEVAPDTSPALAGCC